MKDDKSKKKFVKTKFKARQFLHGTGLGAIAVSFENFSENSFMEPVETYFSISNGCDSSVTLYELKDIKKLSALLTKYLAQVEAVS